MASYTVTLAPGAPQRLPYAGKVLQFVSMGTATQVGLKIESGGDRQDVEDFGQVPAKFKVICERHFDAFELSSAAACTVVVLVTNSDVTLNTGSAVTATIDAAQLPLSVREGAATAVTGATFGTSATLLSVTGLNAARKAVRFYNQGPDAVAIGQSGLTWAGRCIVLAMGDSWAEDDGANLAWYAICNTGAAATLAVQEITG